MITSNVSQLLERLLSAILVVCACIITAIVVRREMGAGQSSQPAVLEQPDWRRFVDTSRADGAAQARAVIVVFGDYQCVYCKVLAERLHVMAPQYTGRVVIQNRHFPLGQHKFARSAAIANECAGAQGRGAEMHMALFAFQDSLGVVPWRSVAETVGEIDLGAFDRAIV